MVRLNKEIADADNDDQPLREKALAGFCHRLFMFAQHKNYQRRQLYVVLSFERDFVVFFAFTTECSTLPVFLFEFLETAEIYTWLGSVRKRCHA